MLLCLVVWQLGSRRRWSESRGAILRNHQRAGAAVSGESVCLWTVNISHVTAEILGVQSLQKNGRKKQRVSCSTAGEKQFSGFFLSCCTQKKRGNKHEDDYIIKVCKWSFRYFGWLLSVKLNVFCSCLFCLCSYKSTVTLKQQTSLFYFSRAQWCERHLKKW